MRARAGCQPCRERHIRCVREKPNDPCSKCIQNSRQCVVQKAQHRFREIDSGQRPQKRQKTNKPDLSFSLEQEWVEIPSTVAFLSDGVASVLQRAKSQDESRKKCNDLDSSEDDPLTTTSAPVSNFVQTFTPDFLLLTKEHTSREDPSTEAAFQVNAAQNSSDPTSPPSETTRDEHSGQDKICDHRQASLDNGDGTVALHVSHASNRAVIARPPHWPFTCAHEALLFSHYIHHLSPSLDACGASSHFGREVVGRARSEPMLMNAIFALSARHRSNIQGVDNPGHRQYAARCINLLIAVLNDTLASWSEDVLCAVVLLRLYEELSPEDDGLTHLIGIRNLLDSTPAVPMDRGLREAASWVSLRQHLFVSLTHQRPLEVNLQLFRCSAVFSDNLATLTSQDWANRIIFLFAEILDFVLKMFTHTDKISSAGRAARWHEFRDVLTDWFLRKPGDLAPLWVDDSCQPRGGTLSSSPAFSPEGNQTVSASGWSDRHHTTIDDADWSPTRFESFAQFRSTKSSDASSSPATARSDPLHSWPFLPVSSPPSLVALQYYHLCRITLAAHSPQLEYPTIGPQHLQARRRADAIVIDGIKHIVGLSVSNMQLNMVMFEASHTLKVFGGYIEDENMRRQAVRYLEWVEAARGWRTGKIVEELEEQWIT